MSRVSVFSRTEGQGRVVTVVDERFRYEARRFTLRFTCESCAYFDGDGERCSHGYPDEPHRARRLETLQSLCFCKEFEMA